MINFKYKEVIKSWTAKNMGIDNSLPSKLLDNLMNSAVGIQRVRDYLKVPLRINSWYRCLKLNMAVGGKKKSAHLSCLAIDFVPIGMKIKDAYRMIAESDIPFDQLILEHSGKTYWIHISFSNKNRRMVFELDKIKK